MISPSHNAANGFFLYGRDQAHPALVDCGSCADVCLYAVPVLGDSARAPVLQPSTAPFGLRFYFALSWSTLAALYVLMVGYVSRDAPRRNMSTRLWVVICLAMPGGIGSVLYFLLRQPVVALCPSCGTSIHTEFHFCPQCAYQVSAACGNCYRGVRITDLYCVYCGHGLAEDNMPSRLRAFQS